jgi:hypothetical protein
VGYVRTCKCEEISGRSGNAEMKTLVYVKRAYNRIACVSFFEIDVKKSVKFRK